ncbi:tetratricopeptide repeat protein [Litoreibacter roseus]|uniref:Uncharacterized protein n=1 Tax=Litoreibacter roseus TaxID=2601869 RepID=A0A6N6JBC4_9RHOB|nr:tetratricopeptide repeat protein [Litoreibacter roseus]GFE63551.1 hypothetical protein KIN_06250 [Litoreibacter roseus]
MGGVENEYTRLASEAERVLSSSTFKRSARSRDLLQYLIDETLAGRRDGLNETVIAQDVLSRDAGFDPSKDPVVRVQMRRLRDLLAKYYDAEAPDATERLALPQGGYRPALFGEAEVTALEPEPRAFPTRLIALSLVVLVGIGVAAFFFLRTDQSVRNTSVQNYPLVTVLPFENTTDDPGNDVFERGFQRQVAADLQRFRTMRVSLSNEQVVSPETAHYFGDAEFALTGKIMSLSNEVDILLSLVDLKTYRTVLRQRFRRLAGALDYYDLMAGISAEISGRVGGPSGAIEKHEFAEMTDVNLAVGLPEAQHLPSYRCIVLYEEFYEKRTPDLFNVAHDCIDARLRANPNDAALATARAFLALQSIPQLRLIDTDRLVETYSLDEAHALASNAVAMDPGYDMAHVVIGGAEFFRGEIGAAIRSLRQAIALNPSNAQALGSLGLAYMKQGDWTRAVESARLAQLHSKTRLPLYHFPAFFDGVLTRDPLKVARAAITATRTKAPYRPVLELLAAQLQGDAGRVEKFRADVQAYAVANGGDPLGGLRALLAEPETTSAVLEVLADAGVEVQIPEG